MMWVRVSTYEGEAGADRARHVADAERARDKVLPEAETMEGFKGLMLVADPASGRSVSLTFWETEDAMLASVEAANTLRAQVSEEAGNLIADVHHYEVLIDERR